MCTEPVNLGTLLQLMRQKNKSGHTSIVRIRSTKPHKLSNISTVSANPLNREPVQILYKLVQVRELRKIKITKKSPKDQEILKCTWDDSASGSGRNATK